ncbi:MASE1 domain-containing protein [Streptacidiphilus griseoplanus]|uniref:MASE1 domain-containing protein n=1 Tax=Peterkaempfera griseoplana TaxID=66896 RepID=UPI001FE1937B|nr:MASE1 domain-containing protein [Peterkaempfera griseoplana]
MLLGILALTSAYYGCARAGLLLHVVENQVTPYWPPTGVALAALLLFGLRLWPAITVGALLVNLPLGPSPPAVVAIAVGNTLAPVCACLALRRTGFRPELEHLRDALKLVFVGALGGMLISATVGSVALSLGGAVARGDFWPTWAVWWTGDAMGVLVFAPAFLLLPRIRLVREVPLRRWAELAGLLTVTLVVSLIAVTSPNGMLFLGFPFLVWAAVRFQLAGAVPCVLLTSSTTVVLAVQGHGRFGQHGLFMDMVTLQAFNGSIALTALLLSAVVTERNRAYAEIRRACIQLAAAVAEPPPGSDGPASRQNPP